MKLYTIKGAMASKQRTLQMTKRGHYTYPFLRSQEVPWP